MSSSVSLEAFSYEVPEGWAERAHADASKYREMYAFSSSNPDGFWDHHGKRIEWIKPYTKVKNTSFDPGKVSIKWFEDGTTNVSMNCIDRHLAKRADQTAIIWEGDSPNDSKRITYRQLHEYVCRLANVDPADALPAFERAVVTNADRTQLQHFSRPRPENNNAAPA